MKCKHQEFKSIVAVDRVENGRFRATIKIKCSQCGEDFQFFGVPPGVDLNGCRTSLDGLELNAAIGTPETLADFYEATTGVRVEFKSEPKATRCRVITITNGNPESRIELNGRATRY